MAFFSFDSFKTKKRKPASSDSEESEKKEKPAPQQARIRWRSWGMKSLDVCSLCMSEARNMGGSCVFNAFSMPFHAIPKQVR